MNRVNTLLGRLDAFEPEPIEELSLKFWKWGRHKKVDNRDWSQDEYDDYAGSGNPQEVQAPQQDPFELEEDPGTGGLTHRERQRLEKEYQKQLRQQFKANNPHVLARLKQNMQARDWKELTKMLAKGAFWGAAGYALPWFFVPAGAIWSYRLIKDRIRAQRDIGLTSRVKLTSKDYQKGDFKRTVSDVQGIGRQAATDWREGGSSGYKLQDKVRQQHDARQQRHFDRYGEDAPVRATALLSAYESLYRCTGCGFVEASEDMGPKDAMAGSEARCSKCGDVMEAVWGHTTLPGAIMNPAMGTSSDRIKKT